MKSKLILSSMIAAVMMMFVFSSCTKKVDNNDPAVLVEDGIYVKGAGTALADFGVNGLMTSTSNEVTKAERAQLKELYVAVKAGAEGFNIINVVGGVPTVYGPGDDFAEVAEADKIGEEPRGWFSRGSVKETATAFTVPEDGLYHVVYDTELGIVVVARVNWGIIGAATPNGWSGSTAMSATFDLNKMTFTVSDVIMTAANWKFRYSDGWKIVIDANYPGEAGVNGINVNTNLGGTIDALVTGGGDMPNAENGIFTVTLTWELGKPYAATLTKTGDYTPPAYPEAMYIVGDATAYGWDSPSTHEDAIMHKVAGGAPTEGLFWKIAYIETGKGFKLSDANWGAVNLGFGDVDEYDANGVAVADNGGKMSVAVSGMYMIVLNLRDGAKKVSISAPMVYGIGDAFGGYTEKVAANLYTVDNTAKTLVSPAFPAAGNFRTYVSHSWIPAWWNAEFVINGTAIEYRNDSGNDPTAVAVTAGKVATFHFDDNTGSIK